MADTQIQLTSPTEWSFRTRKSKKARKRIENRREIYSPIPAFDLGITLKAKFLAVEILVKEAKQTWKTGGFIQQVYPLLLATQATPRRQGIARSNFLLLNRANIIEFPRLSGKSYRLIYSPPIWFRDVSIKIWQYRGVETNFVDDTVKRTEDKINQLL